MNLGDPMKEIIIALLTIVYGTFEYQTLNEVSNLQNNVFQLNYYKEEIKEENLINSEQIDTEDKTSLKEINVNKYLPESYFKIPEENVPIISSVKKNIVNIVYGKEDYVINYYYSTNYSITDIGSKTTLEELYPKRKKLDHRNKEPISLSNKNLEDYYARLKFPYTISYFYDNKIDHEQTISNFAFYGSEIRSYPEKEKEGYQKYYSTIDEDSLTITENKNANTIYVYYEQKST